MKESTKDLKKAQENMRIFAQCKANRAALMASIANELKSYEENAKAAEAELIEFGEKYKDEFDVKGNYEFEDGYIHIVNSAVLVTSKKFDPVAFSEAYPDLIDLTPAKTLKKGEIKKAFMDNDFRKEIKKLGLTMDNEQSFQVISALK